MVEIAPGWHLDVEQSPDWLFVKVKTTRQEAWGTPPLAEQLWELLQQYAVCQLVLELEQLELLHSYLVGQLVLLYKRICAHGGALRLSGLSPRNQEVLRVSRLGDSFPPYRNREEAMQGSYHPRQPR